MSSFPFLKNFYVFLMQRKLFGPIGNIENFLWPYSFHNFLFNNPFAKCIFFYTHTHTYIFNERLFQYLGHWLPLLFTIYYETLKFWSSREILWIKQWINSLDAIMIANEGTMPIGLMPTNTANISIITSTPTQRCWYEHFGVRVILLALVENGPNISYYSGSESLIICLLWGQDMWQNM